MNNNDHKMILNIKEQIIINSLTMTLISYSFFYI
ncbi:unnamed protein product [Schistosoma curassoni]|uniref:CPBP family intramembrane metalloprotease n=1 Tax=Schistosoma curassoni TaxID=6186 RepID=A0A183KKF1_9TREM|nr:unnamed protein product [Schistosoma curassoni]